MSIFTLILLEIIYVLTADPPSFTTEPSDQIVKEFEDTVFLCNATGNPAPKITWMKGGKTVAHGDTLRFSANKSDSGKFWCLAENGLGLPINTSASLDVQCKFQNNVNMLRSHFRTCNLLN